MHLSGLSVHWLLLLLGALGLLTASAAAQSDGLHRQFEVANEAYAQGRYEQAVETYQAILEAGSASGALYHNLGNAYVRLNRTGPAVWAYEKARQLHPEDPRLRHNLEYVRRRAGLSEVGLPPRGLAALIAGWSPLLLLGVGVLALAAGLLGAVFRAGPGQVLAGRRPSAWGPFAVGALLVVVAFGTSYVQAQDRRAVVLDETVPLRTAPSEGAAPDTTLRAGSMVEVRRRQGPWTRVVLRKQTVGWVSAQAVREL